MNTCVWQPKWAILLTMIWCLVSGLFGQTQSVELGNSAFKLNTDDFSVRVSLFSAAKYIMPWERLQYFDADWIEVPNNRRARYYRVSVPLENGEFENIRDYYSSGSIQAYIEKAFRLSPTDAESVWGGSSRIYDVYGKETSVEEFPDFNYTEPDLVRKYIDASNNSLIGVWHVKLNNGVSSREVEMLLWHKESSDKYYLTSLDFSSYGSYGRLSFILEQKSIYSGREFILKMSDLKSNSFEFDRGHFDALVGNARVSGRKIYPSFSTQTLGDLSHEQPGLPDISVRISEADIVVNKVAVIGKASKHCDGRSDEGTELAALVEGELLDRYSVVDRRNLEEILQEQRLAMSGLIFDDSQFATAGCLAGAQATVIASYGCLNQKEQIQLKMVNCSTSDLIWSAIGLNVTELELLNELRRRLNQD